VNAEEHGQERKTLRKDNHIVRLWNCSWPLLVLGLLVAMFFWRSILFGEVLVPADLLSPRFPWKPYFPPDFQIHNHYASDIIDSQYPARAVARHTIHSGQLPLWDPYTSGGKPLGTMPIYALSFPPNVLLWLLPLDVSFTLVTAIRLFISGVAMFAFLRELQLGKMPALVGSTIFAFNGFVIVWLNATAGTTLSLAPLAFWAGERTIKKASVGNLCLLALTVGILVSGGFLAVVLYVLYALSGYLTFRAGLLAWQQRHGREAPRKLIRTGLAIVVGIALMTPQLWSFWEHLELTSYDTQRATQQRGLGSEPLHNLIRYLIPDYYGEPAANDFFDVYPEHTGYVGILPLFLSALALAFAWRQHKAVWFFGLLGMLAFGMVFGAPFNRWIVRLPGLNLGGSPRLKSIFAFSVAVLAAFGLDFLQQQWKSGRLIRKTIAVVALVAGIQGAVILLTERYWGPGGSASHVFDRSLRWLWERGALRHHLFEDFLLYLLWLQGSLVLLTARVKGFISRRWVGLGALILISLDLVGWGISYNRPVHRDQVFPQTPGITFLQSDQDLFRVTGLEDVFPPSTLGVYQLQDIAGHDPLAPDRYRQALQLIDPDTRFGVRGTIMRLNSKTVDLGSPLLDLMNLKYIADHPFAYNEEFITQDGTFVKVYGGPDMTIYENTEVLPRCYVVSQAEVVADPEAILARLASGQVDPREIALLEEEPPEPLSGKSEAEGQVVPEIVSYTANRVVVQTEVKDSALLVLGDTYYPGWKASLDGQPTKIYQANYLFRAVFLPPGEHKVEFVFRPRPYYLGQVVRFSAILTMAAALLWDWKRRRKEA